MSGTPSEAGVMMGAVEVPYSLSHSQADNLAGPYCPASYWFERVIGKPSRPGWAMVGGSALHSASEDWDFALINDGDSDASDERLRSLFNWALDIEIKKTQDKSPYPKDEWHKSGRQSLNTGPAGGPNKKDEAWWRERGPLMLAGWVNWRLTSGWEIALIENPATATTTPDGVTVVEQMLGIEIPFEVDIAGIPVRGYIDRVFERNGEYLVVDLKSGHEPDSTVQLGTYRYGLAKQYGIDPKWGCYWLGGTGLSTSLTDLQAKWPDARVEKRFTAARRRQLAGEFDPKPSNLCGSCGVRDWCAEYGGAKSAEVPQPWECGEVRVAEPHGVSRG